MSETEVQHRCAACGCYISKGWEVERVERNQAGEEIKRYYHRTCDGRQDTVD